jgi:hypothetical protein
MKFSIIIISLFFTWQFSNAQVGIGTTSPDASSLLDLTTTSKGMLVPRMTVAQKLAITTPATGLLIYQTDGTSGFWYYTGSAWVSLLSNTMGWTTSGNTGTVAGTNFIGTTDNIDFVTKTNSTEKLRVTSSGNLGIGTASPGQKLETMNGNLLINNNNNTSGEIQIAEPSTSGSNYTAFKTQAQAANITYTLPAADGTNGQALLTNGSGSLSWSNSGILKGRVYQEYTSYTSTTTTIPFDNTIPQNTEGVEILAATITPTSSSNKLHIRAAVPVSANTVGVWASIAIFRDNTANAIAATAQIVEDVPNFMYNLVLDFEISAGSTSSTTFRVRLGPSSGTLYFNGTSGGQKFGGVCRATITVEDLSQ